MKIFNKFYISTVQKMWISIVIGLIWGIISIYINQGWIVDLSQYYNILWAYSLVYGIAVIPGFFCFFLLSGLFFDYRPIFTLSENQKLPDVSILVAAYNEEAAIHDTLESIYRQDYPRRY